MSRHHKNLLKINAKILNKKIDIFSNEGILKNFNDKKTKLNIFIEFVRGQGLKSTIW